MRKDSTIPSGFCQCGCGQRTRVPRRGGPLRFIRFHHLKLRTPSTVNPSMYTVDPDTGCWNWNGLVYHSGYGRAPSNKGAMTAHRWAYEILGGVVPDGKQLDHLCRNRRCINPDHLEPVTAKENIRRSPRTKLTMDQAREIRSLHLKEPLRDTAARYGVSRSLINRIQLGLAWNEEG
jgi:hypothetical protein